MYVFMSKTVTAYLLGGDLKEKTATIPICVTFLGALLDQLLS